MSSTFTLARSCWRLTRELKEIEASWKRNSDDQRRNDQEKRNQDEGKEEADKNPDRKTYLGSRRVAGIEDSLPRQRRVHVGKTTAALDLKRQRSRLKRRRTTKTKGKGRREEGAKIHTDLDEAGVDAPASEGRRTILGLEKKR